MTALRRSLRRTRRLLGSLLATLIISLALAMALGQLLLPLVHYYPATVARILASRIGQPVTVSTVQGEWQPSGPLLLVQDLTIGSGSDRVRLPRAQLKIDFGSWLSADRRWLELRLTGVKARLDGDADGHWQLAGIVVRSEQVDSAASSALTDLPFGLLLRDLDLEVHDAARQRDFQVHAPVVRLVSDDGTLRAGGSLSVAGAGSMLSVVAHFGPHQRAKLFLSGNGLDLAAWARQLSVNQLTVRSGKGDMRLWLGWDDGQLDRLSAELDVADLAMSTADGSRGAQMRHWQGWIRARHDDDGWQLAIRPDSTDGKPQPESHALVAWQSPDHWRLNVRSLGLAQTLPWLTLLPQTPAPLAAWLQAAAPHGDIDALDLDWQGRSRFNLAGKIAGMGWQAADGIPGVDRLDAVLRGDAEAVVVDLPPQAMSVDVAGVFRKPFVFTSVAGSMAFWQTGTDWHLGTDRLAFTAQDFAGALRGSLARNPDGGLPILDAAAVVTHAEIPVAKQFWPVNVMPPEAVRWLDHGLVSGQTNGRALFRGGLGDWPFPNHHGRFEAVADVRDLVLNFSDDWPVAEGLDARASFVNTSMQVKADAGHTMGNVVDSASGSITDFDHAILDLDVRSHGQAGAMLNYLRKTPIGADHKSAIDALQMSGSAKVNFKLNLPLHDGPDQDPVLSGMARLNNARLTVPDWAFAVEELKGDVNFDLAGFAAPDLTAQYSQVPVALAVRVGGAARDPALQLDAGMRGNFSVQQLAQTRALLAPLTGIAQGNADFRVGLQIPSDSGAHGPASVLSVDSDMRGIALDLPQPLLKRASTALPLHLQLELPPTGNELQFELGKLLAVRVRLPVEGQPLAADVALSGMLHALPATGIRVHGSADTLDISGWLRLVPAASGGAGQALDSLQLDTGHALVQDQDFGKLGIVVTPDEGDTLLSLDGPRVQGSVRLPGSNPGQRGITAKLARLYWPESSDDTDSEKQVAIAPALIPPLHLWVGDLQLGKAKLGDLRFESVPFDAGMQIEHLETQSPDLQISARGRWTGDAQANRSTMVFDLSSGDLGRMLDAFGYAGMVAGGTTLAQINGSWAGPPFSFSLAALDGTIKVHVADGRMLEVEPGVGRLFGLFSIRELPRRLSLDFGDIFRSGFSFNSIEGNFRFADGSAHTDDLAIRGPSAAIDIRGRTDLRQHEYDQWITVVPHLGVTLPLVGAIAGGPVGAAAGLAVQGLLGKGLNRAAQARYHVTGSWDKPHIELVARGDRDTPTASATVQPPAQVEPQPRPPVPLNPPSAAATVPVPASSAGP